MMCTTLPDTYAIEQ